MADEARALKTCPFCGNPVKAGMALTTCPACDTAHHYACWRDQGGCAVAGCSENPAAASAPPSTAASASPTTGSAVAPPRPAAPAEGASFEYSMLDPELERLLAEVYLRLREERFAEVKQRLDEASRLAADHPAVLEAKGDLAFAQGQFREAESLFGRAFKADTRNVLLEEKYAIAVMKVHEAEILSHAFDIPDDVESPWSNRVSRPPWASVLLSLIFPGLGQLYNGDWLKGIGMVFAGILCSSFTIWEVHLRMPKLPEGTIPTAEQVTAAALHWEPLALIVLFAGIAVYGIIDAYLVARLCKALPKLYIHDPAAAKPELKP